MCVCVCVCVRKKEREISRRARAGRKDKTERGMYQSSVDYVDFSAKTESKLICGQLSHFVGQEVFFGDTPGGFRPGSEPDLPPAATVGVWTSSRLVTTNYLSK